MDTSGSYNCSDSLRRRPSINRATIQADLAADTFFQVDYQFAVFHGQALLSEAGIGAHSTGDTGIFVVLKPKPDDGSHKAIKEARFIPGILRQQCKLKNSLLFQYNIARL